MSGADKCQELVAKNPKFEPIRIRLDFSRLNIAQAKLVREVLVPHAVKYIEQTVKVRRVVGPLKVPWMPFHRYGVMAPLNPIMQLRKVSYPETDLVVQVRSDKCDAFMRAGPMAYDACGRPTLGVVYVCEAAFVGHEHSDKVSDQLEAVIVHELMHVLGFTHGSFSTFRNSSRGMVVRGSAVAKRTWFTCSKRADNTFFVNWNVDPVTPGARSYSFSPNVVKAVDARGLKAKDCRCPLDPSRVYTNADIEHCLELPNHCAIAVTSPAVQRQAREFYDCSSLIGQELENTRSSCDSLVDPHWNKLTLDTEVMTSHASRETEHMSTMTLALLEDSGWYTVDYSMATVRSPTGTPGFRQGCAFVVEGKPAVPQGALCSQSRGPALRCADNALRVMRCGSDNVPETDCRAKDPQARCLDTSSGGAGCVSVACAEDRRSYTVPSGERCSAEGRRAGNFVCRDPAVVCADRQWGLHLESRVAVPKATLGQQILGSMGLLRWRSQVTKPTN